jgi:hypothetical protein
MLLPHHPPAAYALRETRPRSPVLSSLEARPHTVHVVRRGARRLEARHARRTIKGRGNEHAKSLPLRLPASAVLVSLRAALVARADLAACVKCLLEKFGLCKASAMTLCCGTAADDSLPRVRLLSTEETSDEGRWSAIASPAPQAATRKPSDMFPKRLTFLRVTAAQPRAALPCARRDAFRTTPENAHRYAAHGSGRRLPERPRRPPQSLTIARGVTKILCGCGDLRSEAHARLQFRLPPKRLTIRKRGLSNDARKLTLHAP